MSHEGKHLKDEVTIGLLRDDEIGVLLPVKINTDAEFILEKIKKFENIIGAHEKELNEVSKLLCKICNKTEIQL